MNITLSKAFMDDVMLKRVFAWLTRNGIGRKFGSLPIGWYQSHQCNAIQVLERAGCDVVRVKLGQVQTLKGGKWQTVISCIQAFQDTDNLTRK